MTHWLRRVGSRHRLPGPLEVLFGFRPLNAHLATSSPTPDAAATWPIEVVSARPQAPQSLVWGLLSLNSIVKSSRWGQASAIILEAASGQRRAMDLFAQRRAARDLMREFNLQNKYFLSKTRPLVICPLCSSSGQLFNLATKLTAAIGHSFQTP